MREAIGRAAGERDRPGAQVSRDDGSSGAARAARGAARGLLTQEGLARLGAIMAVDGEGRLRGIVNEDAVRRALQAP